MSLRRLFESFRPSRAKSEDAQTQSDAACLIVGLGNPGDRYRCSRHNLGFMAADRLAQRCGTPLDNRRFKARWGRGLIDGQTVILAQPQTFMNLSGESVAPMLGYFKLKPGQLIVIHDELDLEPGTVRIKRGGGDAGHNGIRSIIDALGTADFIRVRIGVGHAPQGRDTIGYLVEPMTAQELDAFDPPLERAVEAVQAIVLEGVDRAMGRFNQRL